MNIYVGNLNFNSAEHALQALFQEYGAVTSTKLIMDRDTGRPRGFAFVEMPNDAEARKAIEALDGTEFDGRTLKVNESRPRQDRPRGGGGGGGGGRRDRW